jgi:hypothetical protein
VSHDCLKPVAAPMNTNVPASTGFLLRLLVLMCVGDYRKVQSKEKAILLRSYWLQPCSNGMRAILTKT